jgi:hypothetical protein
MSNAERTKYRRRQQTLAYGVETMHKLTEPGSKSVPEIKVRGYIGTNK